MLPFPGDFFAKNFNQIYSRIESFSLGLIEGFDRQSLLTTVPNALR